MALTTIQSSDIFRFFNGYQRSIRDPHGIKNAYDNVACGVYYSKSEDPAPKIGEFLQPFHKGEKMKKFLGLLFITVLVFCLVKVVGAVPTLQLYIEGGTYYESYEIDNGKDTFEVTESWFTDDNPFSLMIAGASKNGNVDTISDVTLWIAFKEEPGEGTITVKDFHGFIVNPMWQGAQQGIPDPPGWEETNNKTKFPTHGVYPSYYYAFDLPDLNVKDGHDGIYDYNTGYGPNSTPSDTGVLQTYQITYSGYYWLHMDLTGVEWKEDKDKPVFAPFSHDADAPPSSNPVPEPSTMLLFGFGFLSLLGVGLKSNIRRLASPYRQDDV